jgi:hypothetical protein
MRRLVAIMLIGLAFAGCAAESWKSEPSGFLGNYDDLARAAGEPGVLRYEKDGALEAYTRFLIEPVTVLPRPGVDLEKLPQEELHALAADFTAALREQLDERYEVVETPGPDVLRIRGAITNVVPATPALNIHPLTKLSGAGLGGASFEAEGVNAATGERVFAVMVSRGAAKRVGSGLATWADARQVMRDWAAQFRARVDAAHAESPAADAE